MLCWAVAETALAEGERTPWHCFWLQKKYEGLIRRLKTDLDSKEWELDSLRYAPAPEPRAPGRSSKLLAVKGRIAGCCGGGAMAQGLFHCGER